MRIIYSNRSLSFLASYMVFLIYLCTAFTMLLVCLITFDHVSEISNLRFIERLIFVIGTLTIQGLLVIPSIKILGIIKTNRNTFADTQKLKEKKV